MMAVISVPKRSSVSLKLNGGTNTATGSMKTLSTNMSGVKPGDTVNEGVYNVAQLVAPCLDYPVIRIEKYVTTTIESD